MRRIEFAEEYKEANRMFNLCHTAAFAGIPPKDMSAYRKLGKLQDALEGVSHDQPVPGSAEPARVLNDDLLGLELDDGPHDILKDRIFGAGIEWLPAVSRIVTSLYDLIDTAEVVKPKEVKAEGDK